MTSSNDILAQIDSALGDGTVGPDAMRVRPAPEAEPAGKSHGFRGATPTVYIADEVGEWQQVEGIGSIEVCIESPAIDPEFARRWQELSEYLNRVQLERARRAQAVLEAFVQAVATTLAPAVERAAREMSETGDAFRHLPEAEDCNQCTPLPRRDRPAWQTPYGPARRRR